jgi:hypothetical protein
VVDVSSLAGVRLVALSRSPEMSVSGLLLTRSDRSAREVSPVRQQQQHHHGEHCGYDRELLGRPLLNAPACRRTSAGETLLSLWRRVFKTFSELATCLRRARWILAARVADRFTLGGG